MGGLRGAQAGATQSTPGREIRWTLCCGEDDYVACLALLRDEAPPLRLLQVIRNGTSPGVVSATPHVPGGRRRTDRGRPRHASSYPRLLAARVEKWRERERKALVVLASGPWFSAREVLELLCEDGTAESTVGVLLNRLVREKKAEKRRRAAPGSVGSPMEYRAARAGRQGRSDP